MTLRDEFIAATSVPYTDKEVNGVTVRVTGLTAADQLDLEKVTEGSPGEITFWVLERCLVEPDTGSRIFEDGDAALRRLNGEVLAELANEAMRLSGASEAAKN